VILEEMERQQVNEHLPVRIAFGPYAVAEASEVTLTERHLGGEKARKKMLGTTG
jgi:hypothetical protein